MKKEEEGGEKRREERRGRDLSSTVRQLGSYVLCN